jgi:hypothetical protein
MAAWGRILLLTVACGAIVAGCGGDGTDSLPPEDAEILLTRLDEVERGMAEGNCEGPRGAQASADLLREQVGDGELARVPDDLDPELRELLVEGANRLSQLVEEECVEAEEPEPEEIETEPAEPPEPPEPADEDEPAEESEPEEDPDRSGPPGRQPGDSGGGPDGSEDRPGRGPGENQGNEPPTGGIGG